MNKSKYTPAVLGQESKTASSPYNGAHDDFIVIDGSEAGFAAEASEENTYKFQVVSASADTAKTCPISLTLAELIAGGLTVADLTMTGISSSFAEFVASCVDAPRRVVAFKVEASTEAALSSLKVEVSEYKPQVGFTVTKSIYPANFRGPKDVSQTMAICPQGFQMDGQTKVNFSVPFGVTYTLTLVLGASISQAQALRNKAGRAGATV